MSCLLPSSFSTSSLPNSATLGMYILSLREDDLKKQGLRVVNRTKRYRSRGKKNSASRKSVLLLFKILVFLLLVGVNFSCFKDGENRLGSPFSVSRFLSGTKEGCRDES